MTYSDLQRTPLLAIDRTADYERLRTFFDILASGDRSRYAMAATLLTLPPKGVPIRSSTVSRIDTVTTEGFAGEVCPLRPITGNAENVQDPAPGVDFTFKMTIQDLYGKKNYQEMVEKLLKESRENFRPLEELEARRTVMLAAIPEAKDGLPAGSLRLKRPTKRRCVGWDLGTGMDSETAEWLYETADASSEYLAAMNLRVRKPGTLNAVCSEASSIGDGAGARTRLERDILLSKKRRLTEQC